MSETESKVITALIRAFSFLVAMLKKIREGKEI